MYYGDSQTPIGIDDRALAHLMRVIFAKLRRGEAFTLSWGHGDEGDRGRSTIWIHPSMPLRFVLTTSESAELNPEWITALMKSADSTGGVHLVPENLDRS